MDYNNKILIIVGPSGVGKDTLMQKVFEKYPGFFKKGVTHTSRKMREGEKEGFNYYCLITFNILFILIKCFNSILL